MTENLNLNENIFEFLILVLTYIIFNSLFQLFHILLHSHIFPVVLFPKVVLGVADVTQTL